MERQKKGDIETNYEVRSFDAKISFEEYNQLEKKPLIIVLDNLRSAFNVGSIFRLCDALRVQRLFLCGYTPCPPHIKLKKTSLGTVDYVCWQHFDSTVEAVRYLKAQGIAVWAAETTSLSMPFNEIAYPVPLAIVFGNERAGVSSDTLEICDRIVQIPMYGFKNSVNVAASVAVLGYAVVEQR
jgi:tRNA G18 (ribose-2'-O)-methylase SpoU